MGERKKIKPVKAWAVMGDHGLYTGHAMTARQARLDHIWMYYDGYPERPPEHLEREMWLARMRQGDHVVRIEIRVVSP